jgi:hypothetical protein
MRDRGRPGASPHHAGLKDFCHYSLCLRPDLMGTIRVASPSEALRYVDLPDIDRNEDR